MQQFMSYIRTICILFMFILGYWSENDVEHDAEIGVTVIERDKTMQRDLICFGGCVFESLEAKVDITSRNLNETNKFICDDISLIHVNVKYFHKYGLEECRYVMCVQI